jgi:hypothetical protein
MLWVWWGWLWLTSSGEKVANRNIRDSGGR